jgi:transcriptional regulator with XRE-family HTH domain
MMSTLSERVQKVLAENPELDQPTLGKIAGVTKGTVNQWLDGKIKSMKLDYAMRVQKRLGYSAAWLVMGEGAERVGNPDSEKNVKSENTGTESVLSIESAREDRAKLLATDLLAVSPEMRALIDKLVQADLEGGAVREMIIAGVGYLLQSVPVQQVNKKVK